MKKTFIAHLFLLNGIITEFLLLRDWAIVDVKSKVSLVTYYFHSNGIVVGIEAIFFLGICVIAARYIRHGHKKELREHLFMCFNENFNYFVTTFFLVALATLFASSIQPVALWCEGAFLLFAYFCYWKIISQLDVISLQSPSA